MDVLSKIEGTGHPEISTPTYLYFIPQLLHNLLIQNAKPQTHQYGPFASQQLDIYTPAAGTTPAGGHLKPPLFIFYYGGGYMSGRRRMSLSLEAGTSTYLISSQSSNPKSTSLTTKTPEQSIVFITRILGPSLRTVGSSLSSQITAS
jgi:hypothetical protein